MPLEDDQGPREVRVHSLRFWRRNGAVGQKPWHHFMSREVSHWYWIVTIGQKLNIEVNRDHMYPGPVSFGRPKTELGKPRHEKLIWAPKNWALGKKFFRGQF